MGRELDWVVARTLGWGIMLRGPAYYVSDPDGQAAGYCPACEYFSLAEFDLVPTKIRAPKHYSTDLNAAWELVTAKKVLWQHHWESLSAQRLAECICQSFIDGRTKE